jgi:hypothetical protein
MAPYLLDIIPMPPLRDAANNAMKKAQPFLELVAKLKD